MWFHRPFRADEWMRRIDLWLTQIHAITRVDHHGRNRLAYGAYFV